MFKLSPELAALFACLTPEQQQTLLPILESARDEESFFRELEKHSALLSMLSLLVASEGSRAATDLQAIVEELSQPVKSLNEMPWRIEICQQALARVHREENADLWAWLHVELAISLAQSPQGDRGWGCAGTAYEGHLYRVAEMVPSRPGVSEAQCLTCR